MAYIEFKNQNQAKEFKDWWSWKHPKTNIMIGDNKNRVNFSSDYGAEKALRNLTKGLGSMNYNWTQAYIKNKYFSNK